MISICPQHSAQDRLWQLHPQLCQFQAKPLQCQHDKADTESAVWGVSTCTGNARHQHKF